MSSFLHVLYEDNHVLAVLKPCRLATQGLPAGEPTVLSVAKDYVRERYDKPGNVYLGVVSRLDTLVSGVVLLARTSKAAARLNEQFRTRQVEKIYWAVAGGVLMPADGTCIDWIVGDEQHRKVRTAKPGTEGAKEARLHYRTLKRLPAGTLLEITLETGRKHQIRVQLAKRGAAILGDFKYGNRFDFGGCIALHARRVAFQHPTRDERIEITAPLPADWSKLGVNDSESRDQ